MTKRLLDEEKSAKKEFDGIMINYGFTRLLLSK